MSDDDVIAFAGRDIKSSNLFKHTVCQECIEKLEFHESDVVHGVQVAECCDIRYMATPVIYEITLVV